MRSDTTFSNPLCLIKHQRFIIRLFHIVTFHRLQINAIILHWWSVNHNDLSSTLQLQVDNAYKRRLWPSTKNTYLICFKYLSSFSLNDLSFFLSLQISDVVCENLKIPPSFSLKIKTPPKTQNILHGYRISIITTVSKLPLVVLLRYMKQLLHHFHSILHHKWEYHNYRWWYCQS